jgi:hypothetical protein
MTGRSRRRGESAGAPQLRSSNRREIISGKFSRDVFQPGAEPDAFWTPALRPRFPAIPNRHSSRLALVPPFRVIDGSRGKFTLPFFATVTS